MHPCTILHIIVLWLQSGLKDASVHPLYYVHKHAHQLCQHETQGKSTQPVFHTEGKVSWDQVKAFYVRSSAVYYPSSAFSPHHSIRSPDQSYIISPFSSSVMPSRHNRIKSPVIAEIMFCCKNTDSCVPQYQARASGLAHVHAYTCLSNTCYHS